MNNKSVMTEEKMTYLSMVQEPIGRLSTASSIIKGFAATIVTGTAAISFSELELKSNLWMLVVFFVPIIAFLALDIYYLQLEKKYRGLYSDILNNIHPVNFSMDLPADKKFKKRAKLSVWQCMKSPSIWLFYPAMFCVLFAIYILKVRGVI